MVFKTSFKGYDKSSTLDLVEKLTQIMLNLESGSLSVEAAEAKITELNPKNMKTVLIGGFNKEDVEAFYKSMADKIRDGYRVPSKD